LNKKLVGFCRTSDFSFNNFVGLDSHVNLSDSESRKTQSTHLWRAVGILEKLKHYLTRNALSNLYYSLIHSHFTYGSIAWVNTNPSYLLNFSIETTKFIHKYVNKKLLTIFDSYFVLTNTTHRCNTRFSIQQNFHIPLYKTKRT